MNFITVKEEGAKNCVHTMYTAPVQAGIKSTGKSGVRVPSHVMTLAKRRRYNISLLGSPKITFSLNGSNSLTKGPCF